MSLTHNSSFFQQHYLIRVGNGIDFYKNCMNNIWNYKSKYRHIVEKMRAGDILWFIQSKKNSEKKIGKILGVATFSNHCIKPLCSLRLLETIDEDNYYDMEIKYYNLYLLENYNLYTNYKYTNPFVNYNLISKNIDIILPLEYKYIKRYLQIAHLQNKELITPLRI